VTIETDNDRAENATFSGILEEAVRRILTVVKPQRIILFGSGARKTMEPDSDLDLLIVMPDGIHRRNTSVKIYKALRGIGVPKDVIVVTDQDVMAYRFNPSLILKPALEEGKVLYASA
jgi:predicted nucleotidyltransferase